MRQQTSRSRAGSSFVYRAVIRRVIERFYPLINSDHKYMRHICKS
jgi:hypothetical protein